jgi:predicted nucleotidyltransferase component of viral defense system
MKAFNEQHIHKAEIAQLILLFHIYAQTGSFDLIFQGGTALRWCYGGSRFSEDLDFVTTLSDTAIDALLKKTLRGVEREMVPHFGAGRLSVADKSVRKGSRKLLVTWQPDAVREKITIKLECEPLVRGTKLDTEKLVMSALPSVSYLVMTGEFRIPRPNSVMIVESPAEILSDKVRALLERKYLKGRDLFDIWLLRQNRAGQLKPDLVERKLRCYSLPFTASRTPDFFLQPQSETALIEVLEQDLARFLPPGVMAAHRENRYRDFLEAVRALCLEVKMLGGDLA